MRDVMAGVTLASLNVPQLLGYARIAGMPPVTGLYTALLVPIAFAAFGSSRHLVVAADSGTAAILAAALSRMAEAGSAQYLSLAATTALLTAGLLLLARIFRLGFLADFLSRTVLVGFLTGIGAQVAIAMLGDMLGIGVDARDTILQVRQVAGGLPRVNVPTLILSSLVVAAILGGRRFAPRDSGRSDGRCRFNCCQRRLGPGASRYGDDRSSPERVASVRSSPCDLE